MGMGMATRKSNDKRRFVHILEACERVLGISDIWRYTICERAPPALLGDFYSREAGVMGKSMHL